MSRTWTRSSAQAPGPIIFPDGSVVRLDQPSTGAIPHVFADIQSGQQTIRRLIEPGSTVRVGDHLLSISGLADDVVQYRTSHVHLDHQPLLRRLSGTFGRAVSPA